MFRLQSVDSMDSADEELDWWEDKAIWNAVGKPSITVLDTIQLRLLPDEYE